MASFLLLAAIFFSTVEYGELGGGIPCDERDGPFLFGIVSELFCPISTQGGYSGPPDFKAIFAGKRTKAAQYSDDIMSSKEMTLALNVVNGVIGTIPVVGALTFYPN